MRVALLRVGIDTGSGGIHGPLFKDGSFEYLPIPDGFGIDARTYGNAPAHHGGYLVDFFPEHGRTKMAGQSLHVDPEFATFTYGDPTPPKAGLRRLERGDLLVFYCGLQGWDHEAAPALHLMGYFEVLTAGRAMDYSGEDLMSLFGENFHVRHASILEQQKSDLVLVRGSDRSRLLRKAARLSVTGRDRSGRPLKVLSPEMCRVFGEFGGRLSIQRSPTRWVNEAFVSKAAEFVRSLE